MKPDFISITKGKDDKIVLCPKCGNEIKENNKNCKECGYIIKDINNNDNIYNILMNIKVELYLKWGGIVLILLALFLVVPTYLISENTVNINNYITVYNTINSTITVIMRGVYYYGIGVIIILLKKLLEVQENFK